MKLATELRLIAEGRDPGRSTAPTFPTVLRDAAAEIERGSDLRCSLLADLAENTAKAWDSLARYKFWMFGYHAAQVVKLRRSLGLKGSNPFKALVAFARSQQGTVAA